MAILLLAAFLRGGYLTIAPKDAQFTHVDAIGYHWLAINMVERGLFSMNTEPPFRPDSVRAPLYPLFVAGWYAIDGPAPEVVVHAHLLLDVLTVAVLYRLGRLIAGIRAGHVAALLYALNPSSWRFINELLTEILFGLLLTTAIWMLARYILRGRLADAIRCGVVFGLGILTKPNVQFLPLVLLVIVVHSLYTGRKRWWQGGAAVMVAIGVMLMPWVIRNRIIFGEWFYTRTFDDNLAHVSAVATLAEANDEAVAPWTPRWEALYERVIVRTALQYGWEATHDARLSARERDERLQQTAEVAREIVREHPVDFFVAHIRAWFRAFIPQEYKFWYTRLTGRSWTALIAEGDALGRALKAAGGGAIGKGLTVLVQERLLALPPLALALWLGWGTLYIVATVLFVIGALRLQPRLLSLFLVATIFYVTFVPGPISQIRFRLPVTPMILLLMTIGALGQATQGVKMVDSPLSKPRADRTGFSASKSR